MIDALRNVYALCTPNTIILVGQSIGNDCKKWLDLHHKELIDLAELFKFYEERWYNYHKVSLRDATFSLLRINLGDGHHSPVEDARMSIRLYNTCGRDEKARAAASDELKNMFLRAEFPQKNPLRASSAFLRMRFCKSDKRKNMFLRASSSQVSKNPPTTLQ